MPIALWPCTHENEVAPILPKWLHTVQSEHNFVSEWQACDAAFHLAIEVGILSPPRIMRCQRFNPHGTYSAHCDDAVFDSFAMSNRFCTPDHAKSMTKKQLVSFSDVLCIKIGDDDSQDFHQFEVHVDAMKSPLKPWALTTPANCSEAEPHPASVSHIGIGSDLSPPCTMTVQSQVRGHDTRKHPQQSTVKVSQLPSPTCLKAEVFSQFEGVGDSVTLTHPQQDGFDCSSVHCDGHVHSISVYEMLSHFDPSGSSTQVQASCNHNNFDGETNFASFDCTTVVPQTQDSLNSYHMNGSHQTTKQSDNHLCHDATIALAHAQNVLLQESHGHFCKALDAVQNRLNMHPVVQLAEAHSLSSRSRMITGKPSTVAYDRRCIHHKNLGIPQGTKDPEIFFMRQIGSVQPAIIQARLEHESPLPPFLRNNQDENDPDDEDMDPPDRPVLPWFVVNLANRMERIGINPYDNDFDLAVRTWYIDHRTIHRWTAPRLLQLVGPPHGWEAQIQSIWIDQINTEDWFDVVIIEPDPPRLAQHSFVVYDMVVTQSLELPRYSAMVTVLPGQTNTFSMFSVACSLPEMVGGFDLIQAADAGQQCRFADCLITHRWIQIPNTLGPTHRVGQGDGYQIVVHALAQGTGRRNADDTSSSDAITASPRYSPGRHSQPSSSQQPARFTTVLHLFQLDGVEVSVAIVNDQRIQPTQEIAAALNIPFDCLEALHVMPHCPYQIPEYEISAVVQRTGDLAIRTTDRLLLVDIIYHHHPSSEGIGHRPTVIREVQRVGHQILRQQILLAAAVHHYCLHVASDCAVTLDSQPWPETDVMPRPVRHGSYAQVVVPPPATHDVPTQTAVEVARQIAEEDADIRDLVGDSDLSDDTSLTQIAITSRPKGFWIAKLPIDVDHIRASTSVDQDTWSKQSLQLAEPVGAVLQVKPDLNPHSNRPVTAPMTAHTPQSGKQHPTACTPNLACFVDTVSTSDSPLANHTQDEGPTGTHSAVTAQSMSLSHTDLQHGSISALSTPSKQTKLSQFFPKRGVQKAPKGLQQTKISNFFATKLKEPKHDANCVATGTLEPTGMHTPVLQDEQAQSDPIAMPGDRPAHQWRTGFQHEAEPPQFETRVPPPQQQAQGGPQPRPSWHIELHAIFQEHATVQHRETGPEMSVEVWYVHHTNMPRCNAPRLIRLDDVQELWYADLCNAWFDQIQRLQPIRIHVVKPTPAYQLRPQAIVHLILEQGMTPQRAAILFTAAFHGGVRTGLLQQAESSPADICTDQVIQDHGLQPQCTFRPCHLFSGRYRFDPHDPVQVPSGISVLLDVGDHRIRHSHPAGSSHEAPREPRLEEPATASSDQEDSMSMMQTPKYKAFPKSRAQRQTSFAQSSTAPAHHILQIHQPITRDASGPHQCSA